jgi:hypothetical protein
VICVRATNNSCLGLVVMAIGRPQSIILNALLSLRADRVIALHSEFGLTLCNEQEKFVPLRQRLRSARFEGDLHPMITRGQSRDSSQLGRICSNAESRCRSGRPTFQRVGGKARSALCCPAGRRKPGSGCGQSCGVKALVFARASSGRAYRTFVRSPRYGPSLPNFNCGNACCFSWIGGHCRNVRRKRSKRTKPAPAWTPHCLFLQRSIHGVTLDRPCPPTLVWQTRGWRGAPRSGGWFGRWHPTI